MAEELARPRIIVDEDATTHAQRAISNLVRVIDEDPFAARESVRDFKNFETVMSGTITPKEAYPRHLLSVLERVWQSDYDQYIGFDGHTENDIAKAQREWAPTPSARRFGRITTYITSLAVWSARQGRPETGLGNTG